MQKTKREHVIAYVEEASQWDGYNVSQLSDKAPIPIIPTIEMLPNGLVITLGTSSYFLSHLSSIELSSTLAEAVMSYAKFIQHKEKEDEDEMC